MRQNLVSYILEANDLLYSMWILLMKRRVYIKYEDIVSQKVFMLTMFEVSVTQFNTL